MKSKTTALVLATAAAVASVVIGAMPASAIGGTCSATRVAVSRTGPDPLRARAICSQLNGDTKARGELVNWGPEPNDFTLWFTTLNKYYYSDWSYVSTSAAIELAGV